MVSIALGCSWSIFWSGFVYLCTECVFFYSLQKTPELFHYQNVHYHDLYYLDSRWCSFHDGLSYQISNSLRHGCGHFSGGGQNAEEWLKKLDRITFACRAQNIKFQAPNNLFVFSVVLIKELLIGLSQFSNPFSTKSSWSGSGSGRMVCLKRQGSSCRPAISRSPVCQQPLCNSNPKRCIILWWICYLLTFKFWCLPVWSLRL